MSPQTYQMWLEHALYQL